MRNGGNEAGEQIVAQCHVEGRSHFKSDFLYFFFFDQSGERVDEFRMAEGEFLHERIVRHFDRECSSMESRNVCNGSEGFSDGLLPCFFELFEVFAPVQFTLHD